MTIESLASIEPLQGGVPVDDAALPPAIIGSLSPSPGGRLQGLPTALPVPLHRPAAGVPRRAAPPAARWCTRCWNRCSTCRRRSAPRRGPRRCSPEAWARRARRGARGRRAVRRRRRRHRFAEWLGPPPSCCGNYFPLEDPCRLEPAAREQLVELILDGVRLRGLIDRVDVSPAGDIRIVDYKTGASPREPFEAKALFQMKFYALVAVAHARRRPAPAPADLPADTDTLSYRPTRRSCARLRAHACMASGRPSSARMQTGDFRPNPVRLCDWCDHKALCPAFGGTPPPFPHDVSPFPSPDRRVDHD